MSIAQSRESCSSEQVGEFWPPAPAGSHTRIADQLGAALDRLAAPAHARVVIDQLSRFLFVRDDPYGARGVPTCARHLAWLGGAGLASTIGAMRWLIGAGVLVQVRDRSPGRGPRAYLYHLAHPSGWTYPAGRAAPVDRPGDLQRRTIPGSGAPVCAFPTWSAPAVLPPRRFGDKSYPQGAPFHDRGGSRSPSPDSARAAPVSGARIERRAAITSRARSSSSEIPDQQINETGAEKWDRCWVDTRRGRIGLVDVVDRAACELWGHDWPKAAFRADSGRFSFPAALVGLVVVRVALVSPGSPWASSIPVRGALRRAAVLAAELRADELDAARRLEARAIEDRAALVVELRALVVDGELAGVDVGEARAAAAALAAGDGEPELAGLIADELRAAIQLVNDQDHMIADLVDGGGAASVEQVTVEGVDLVDALRELGRLVELGRSVVSPAATGRARLLQTGRALGLAAALAAASGLLATAAAGQQYLGQLDALARAAFELRASIVNVEGPPSIVLERSNCSEPVPAHERSDLQDAACGVVEENGALPYVAADGARALVPGLAHDRGLGTSGAGGLGAEAASERVTGELVSVEPGQARGALYDGRHNPIAEPGAAHPIVTVDGPKQSPVHDAGPLDPGFRGRDRAQLQAFRPRKADHAPLSLLVGFGRADRDGKALGAGAKVAELQTYQLRSAKRPRKTNEEDRPVAVAGDGGRARSNHRPQVVEHGGLPRPTGGDAQTPAGAAHHRAHLRAIGGTLEPGGLVGDGDRGQLLLERGDGAPEVDQVGEVGAERARRGRSRVASLELAPGRPLAPGAGVGAPRGGGDALGSERRGEVDQLGERERGDL